MSIGDSLAEGKALSAVSRATELRFLVTGGGILTPLLSTDKPAERSGLDREDRGIIYRPLRLRSRRTQR
jgi:hypothetical protein